MAEPSGRPLLCAVCTTLRLANSSVDSLTISQLSVLQAGLRRTLRIVDKKRQEIQASLRGGLFWKVQRGWATHLRFSEDEKVVIDLSDCECDESNRKHHKLSRSFLI